MTAAARRVLALLLLLDFQVHTYALAAASDARKALGLDQAFRASRTPDGDGEIGVEEDGEIGSEGDSRQSQEEHSGDSAAQGHHAKVNYAADQRKAMRAKEYMKEFVVDLNLSRAHESGVPLGIAIRLGEDWKPPAIEHMSKWGLAEDWNKANPDNKILPGDEIVQVNDIQWHHNQVQFTERIKGQYLAGRDAKPGAKATLTLHVQRPWPKQTTRFELQREDLRKKLYAKEFSIDLTLPANETSRKTMSKVLGWELNITDDWVPISLKEVKETGLLAEWNKAHPDDAILAGDQIMRINRRNWLWNSSVFRNHIEFNWEHRDRLKIGDTMSLGIRRLREVQDEWDAAHGIVKPEEGSSEVHSSSGWPDAVERQQKITELHQEGGHQKRQFTGQESQTGEGEEKKRESQTSETSEESEARAVKLTAKKIKVLLKYWNHLFPEDPIETTGARLGKALQLVAHSLSGQGPADSGANSASTAASSAASAAAPATSAGAGAAEDDDDLIGASED